MKLGENKVVAVVTDHAANMKNAWKKLSGDDSEYEGVTFPWILFEGCKAHMLNLAARGICEKTAVADCLKRCCEIARFFRYVALLIAFLHYLFQEEDASTYFVKSASRRKRNIYFDAVTSANSMGNICKTRLVNCRQQRIAENCNLGSRNQE